jgi:hypothetical protein
MHMLIKQAESNKTESVDKMYKGTLRASITSLKSECKAKMEVSNMSPPKKWEDREALKERAIHYSRQRKEREEGSKKTEEED